MERERDYQEFAAYEQVASLMERHGVAEDATPKETIERVGAAGQLTDADLGALAELGWDTTAWSAGRPPFDQERAMALLLAAGYRYAEMLAADPDAQPLAASYVFEDVLIHRKVILGDCWHLLDSSWHLLRADARYDDADPDLSSPGAYVVGLIRNHYLTATAANALPDLLTMIGLPRVANALPMWETVDQASDGDGEER